MWSALINAAKSEYNATHLWPRMSTSSGIGSLPSSAPHSVYHDEQRGNKPLKIPSLGRYREHNLRISHRTSLQQNIVLHGWPSRGGVIILEDATAPDFDTLHLDPLDPPLRRDPDQDAEDAFCRSLLRLGATWWDSKARHDFVGAIEDGVEEAHEALDADESLRPTSRERLWVRIAWPTHTPGALCVLACETTVGKRRGDEKVRPRHYGIISLARTMDERCSLLQRLGGIMYASIGDYQGPTFIKAWEEDHQGEKGPLLKVEFIDPSKYGGHPDDALGQYLTSTV